MASSTKVVVDAPVKFLWDAIVDIEKYPDFQKDIKKVEVKSVEGSKRIIYHEIEIIKRVFYILEYNEEIPLKKFTWKLVDCSMVKLPLLKEFKVMEKNDGFWELNELGPDKCEGIYNIDIKLASKIPGNITDMLTRKSLPGMMASFKKRAEMLAGKK